MNEFSTLEEARRFATQRSRMLRIDVGIEYNSLFKYYHTFLLPRPESRQGFELRCEVVKPTDPVWP